MRQARLGEVVESMKNGIYKPASEYAADGIPCLRMYNIDAGHIVWRDIKRMRVTKGEYEEYGLHEGDLLVNRVNSRELVGKTACIPCSLEPSVFESKNIRVRLNQKVAIPKFINYQLLARGSRHFASNAQQVVGMASISQKQLADFPIVLADLGDQRVIVSEIEKQFSRLDEAVANLKRVKANIERYVASVLKAAIVGSLVPTEAELARREGRRFEGGSQLLMRVFEMGHGAEGKPEEPTRRNAKRTAPVAIERLVAPEGWVVTRADQVGDIVLGRQRAPQYLTGRCAKKYLRVANIKDDWIDFDDLESMDFDEAHAAKYRLAPGDILVSEGQSPELLGQSAIFHGYTEELCFQKTLHRFRADERLTSAKYAQIVFRAHVKAGVFRRLGSITTNIGHLTLEKFGSSPISGNCLRLAASRSPLLS